MISVKEAWEIISKTKLNYSKIEIDILNSLNKTNLYLDEDIFAERDQPPFNRVAMDGIAIDSNYGEKLRQFHIRGVQKAGTPQLILKHDSCIEVMTGAVLPLGANTVIPYEEICIQDGVATLKDGHQFKIKQNIHWQGDDFKKDTLLLGKGTKLDQTSLNLCLGQGNKTIQTRTIKSVAIVSTGDELIEAGELIEEFQIRKTNVYLIESILKKTCSNTLVQHYHLNDIESEIYEKLQNILDTYEIIIITGGVSKGKFDYVPSVLADLKVVKKIHNVKQRPGKPMWFGVGDRGQLVFAMPGNPISSAVCFVKYVSTFIEKSLAQKVIKPSAAFLSEEINFKKDFTYFRLVKIDIVLGQQIATPVKMNGSGDLNALALSDGFIELPQNESKFLKNDLFNYYSWNRL